MTNDKHHNRRAYFFMTITTMCWGGNAVLSRMAVGEISPMMVVSLRWFGALALMTIFANKQIRRDWPVLRTHLPYFAAMGALGFTGFNALFYLAAHSTTAINLGIIQGAVPVFVLLGAFAVYGTAIKPLQAAGVTITMVGVLTVGSGGDIARLAALAFNHGDILMIAACFLYAGYTLGLRRRPPVSALGIFALIAAAAFAASLPLTMTEAALGQLQWPTPRGWLIIALITLFPSFLAQILFIRGVELIGPGRASIFVNLVPVFGSVFAVIFLQEPFQVYHGAALALVLGGIWLSERGKAL